jgi:hypothetical protein
MICKLVPAPSASCDGYGPRTERFTASNVARGIANNIDLGSVELLFMLLPRTSSSEPAKLVSIAMIIGKCAEFEKMPDAVVLEL